ncbi:MAG: helix-turn-helix domain-containing protein [Thermodesulfobacteriota bacterium]|nr:helix-turn-helix domain-containing protein [Thermodesulfobacteriota bacterium]
MFSEQVDEREWFTLQEASKITGKTPSSLRRLIQRKIIERVKKEHSKHGEYWLIHKEELDSQGVQEAFGERPFVQGVHSERGEGVQMNVVNFETYDQHRREWEQRCSQLEQGMMMYRYKFEELDRKLKALPAPPEFISEEIRQKDTVIKEAQKVLQDAHESIVQKDEALVQAQKIIAEEQFRQQQQEEAMEQLRVKLQKEEQAKEEYRIQWELAQAELKRPWWKMALIAIGMWKI